jgi:hypothetical protein
MYRDVLNSERAAGHVCAVGVVCVCVCVCVCVVCVCPCVLTLAQAGSYTPTLERQKEQ